MIIKSFESFNGPGECRMVNLDEWRQFHKTHKTSPMNSNDLKKLEPLGLELSEPNISLRYGLKIHLNGGVSITIEKFEDEWWGVRTSVFTSVWIYNQYICDGLDSVVDFIHRINNDSRILIKSPFFD